MIYEMYGLLHKMAKKALGKSVNNKSYRMVSVDANCLTAGGLVKQNLVTDSEYFNEMNPIPEKLLKSQIYPLENIVPNNSCLQLKDTYSSKEKKHNIQGTTVEKSEAQWFHFIESSVIEEGYRNEGLCYAGYILEQGSWCLPSWIWTNAAIIRMLCGQKKVKEAEKMAQKLISLQQECGGWIVRNDYNAQGAVPTIAPNDSAYIANNALVELYLCTGKTEYLQAAEKCADWIIKTARPDGMVYIGYDTKKFCWIKDRNIVDVGFTAGLFAKLFKITHKKTYKDFLERFLEKYLDCFYREELKGFVTSLDKNDQPLGGMFGRGQAWALEGIIPAYEVLQTKKLERIIQTTINNLLQNQKDGGWAYNLSKPLMGIDCKAVPILGCCLMQWYQLNPKQVKLKKAAQNALNWCIRHTAADGEQEGGIFSYTTEGAIVHHMYTNTAFVYSSAYAIELKHKLAEAK